MRGTVRSKPTRLLGSVPLALALLATTAGAAELNTALLRTGGSATVDYRCHLTNLGTKPIENFTITIFNSNNTVVSTITFPTLGPGLTSQVTVFGDDATAARCKATGNFSKRKVAMTLQIINDTTGITQLAIPGQ